MSYKLENYTEKQRLDFIVEHNHNKGLKIEDVDGVLYALEANEIIQEGRPIIDPDYETKQAGTERERINGLKVTKRVFALALQELGITYTQLKSLIEANEQAQLEWDLCVELERSNPLLDIMAEETGLLTSEMLDYIFQKANGEEVEMPVVKENAVDVV